jgi:hypothetical protein
MNGGFVFWSSGISSSCVSVTRGDRSACHSSQKTREKPDHIIGDDLVLLDPTSNVTARRVFDPGGNLARTRSYTYDAVNRVAQAIGAQGQTTAYAKSRVANESPPDWVHRVTRWRWAVLQRLGDV